MASLDSNRWEPESSDSDARISAGSWLSILSDEDCGFSVRVVFSTGSGDLPVSVVLVTWIGEAGALIG